MSSSSAAYDEDFHAWTQAQAAELRRAGADRVNAPIDWENVAEEIESMGRSEWSEIDSRITVLVAHLLKWLYCTELLGNCARQWRLTIVEQRKMLKKRLRQSPSLRRVAYDGYAEIYADARETAALEAEVSPARFPVEPAFTLDDALDPAYPADLFPPEWRA